MAAAEKNGNFPPTHHRRAKTSRASFSVATFAATYPTEKRSWGLRVGILSTRHLARSLRPPWTTIVSSLTLKAILSKPGN